MTRITVRFDDDDLQKLDVFIGKEYPKYKTVSKVIRTALKEFLAKNLS